ncbi:MAG: carboxypeptidase-like regulatory domain-containing protein [Balneolaceae bacterium]
MTNSEGYFSISVEELPAVLTVRYIGYESARIEVTGPSDLSIHVELTPSVTEMDEIVVTDRDTGLTIMERVIERKKLWRQGLKTYRAEAYTRQALRNDTSIVSIMESSSIAYWDHEKGHREVLLSSRQTSNISKDENFAGVTYLPNFYDDDIEIAGYNMVGITHPDPSPGLRRLAP